MKSFKKLILLTLTVVAVLSVSCKKYEDGPAFSLRTKKARLAGDWKIEAFTLNGVDHTSDMTAAVGSSYRVVIDKGGSYKITGDNISESGKWELGEDKDDVTFTDDNPPSGTQAATTYRILRLKNKELWLRHTASNGDQEVTKYKQ